MTWKQFLKPTKYPRRCQWNNCRRHAEWAFMNGPGRSPQFLTCFEHYDPAIWGHLWRPLPLQWWELSHGGS